MTSNQDSLSVGVRHEQRSVSICEDRVVIVAQGGAQLGQEGVHHLLLHPSHQLCQADEFEDNRE